MEPCTRMRGVTDLTDIQQDKRNACTGSKLHFKRRTKRGSTGMESDCHELLNQY